MPRRRCSFPVPRLRISMRTKPWCKALTGPGRLPCMMYARPERELYTIPELTLSLQDSSAYLHVTGRSWCQRVWTHATPRWPDFPRPPKVLPPYCKPDRQAYHSEVAVCKHLDGILCRQATSPFMRSTVHRALDGNMGHARLGRRQ